MCQCQNLSLSDCNCNRTQPCVEEPIPSTCSNECVDFTKAQCVRFIGKISNNIGLSENPLLSQFMVKVIARLNNIPPSFESTSVSDFIFENTSVLAGTFTLKQNGLADIITDVSYKLQGIFAKTNTGTFSINSTSSDTKLVFDTGTVINDSFNLVLSSGNYNTIESNATLTARAGNHAVDFKMSFSTEQTKTLTFKIKVNNGSGATVLTKQTIQTTGTTGVPKYYDVNLQTMYEAVTGGMLYTVEIECLDSGHSANITIESGSIVVKEATF